MLLALAWRCAFADSLPAWLHLTTAAVGAEGKQDHSALSAAVSAALLLAVLAGVAQAVLLTALGGRGLAWWGAAPGGPLFQDAAAYLSMRALAAPFTVCMLVLQGCFRCSGWRCGAGSVTLGSRQGSAAWRRSTDCLPTGLCTDAHRGLGDTRTPFTATLLANVLNVGLEALFLFRLGWGVGGAALAVGLSQVRRRGVGAGG